MFSLESFNNRRLDIEAVVVDTAAQAVAARQDTSIARCVGTGFLKAAIGCLVDDRAHEDVLVERVANPDRPRELHKPVHKGRVVAGVDIDFRVGRALLPLQPEGRAHDALRCSFKISRRRDIGRVLAAHFGNDGTVEGSGRYGTKHGGANLVAAREGETVETRMVDHSLAGRSIAANHVEYAGRKPRCFRRANDQGTCKSSKLAWLVDD